MEFLTTYGWAILILIIVIVALANLGVFRSPNTPNTCSVSAPFACSDVKVNGTASIVGSAYNNVTLQANNVASFSVGNYVSSAGKCNNVDISRNTFNGNGANYVSLICQAIPTKGDKEIGQFDITYTLVGVGTAHTTVVRFSATIE